jgi:hypothetical protein
VSSSGTYRYQVRAASRLARYLPIFAGTILATAFTLSVLYDGTDIARAAWVTGDELLGMFGGFGLVVLPVVFLVSAVLRRGVRRRILRMNAGAETIDLILERGRRAVLSTERIRSGYAQALPFGRVRLSLELSGGVTDGDRVIFELDGAEAAPLLERFVGRAPRFELVSSSWWFGSSLTAASVAVGAAIAHALGGRLAEVVDRFPFPGELSSVGPGFTLGLTVAAVGFVRALVAMAASPPDVVLGVDGVRVEGVVRRRFFPYASITAARATPHALLLDLQSGDTVLVPAPGAGRARMRALAEAVAARIGESVPSSARLPSLSDVSVGKWREAIVAGAAGGTGYREASISNEALERSLLGPGLTCEARVATAIALLARGEEPTHIRVAASAVADDTTRALLERLAEGEADDAALETLLLRKRTR